VSISHAVGSNDPAHANHQLFHSKLLQKIE